MEVKPISINSYVINLDCRQDRMKKFLKNPFEKLDFILNIERISAISLGKDMNRISCALSHKKCIEKAKKDNLDMILIFEDDVEFKDIEKLNEYWKTISSQINKIPDWEILLLSASYGDYIFWYKETENILKVSNYFCGAYSIIVRNTAFDKIIKAIDESYENLKFDIDIDLDIYSKVCEDNTYVCLPYMTVSGVSDFSNIREKDTNDAENILFMEQTLKILRE